MAGITLTCEALDAVPFSDGMVDAKYVVQSMELYYSLSDWLKQGAKASKIGAVYEAGRNDLGLYSSRYHANTARQHLMETNSQRSTPR